MSLLDLIRDFFKGDTGPAGPPGPEGPPGAAGANGTSPSYDFYVIQERKQGVFNSSGLSDPFIFNVFDQTTDRTISMGYFLPEPRSDSFLLYVNRPVTTNILGTERPVKWSTQLSGTPGDAFDVFFYLVCSRRAT